MIFDFLHYATAPRTNEIIEDWFTFTMTLF